MIYAFFEASRNYEPRDLTAMLSRLSGENVSNPVRFTPFALSLSKGSLGLRQTQRERDGFIRTVLATYRWENCSEVRPTNFK